MDDAVAMWGLLVVLVLGGAACKDGSGAAGFLTDGAVTDLPTDRSLASDACPLLETGVDPASRDGGNVPGGRQCGGSGSAVIASTHGSFELHSVFVVVYTCAGSGFTIQFADDSTPRRSVEFSLPLSPGDPAALLGTRSIGCTTVSGTFSTPYCEETCVQS